MEHPVFERDPSQKSEAERREVPPLLKLALELGPLLVFFFANARGEMLIERFRCWRPSAHRSFWQRHYSWARP